MIDGPRIYIPDSCSMHAWPDFCLNFTHAPLNDPQVCTTVSLSAEVYEPITTIVDREEAGDIFVSNLFDTLQYLRPQAPLDPRLFPFLATYAVPGGGKSYFLDQLAACKGRLPGSKVHVELDEILKETIFVNISYNGMQQGGPETTMDQGLAIRLLHS